MTNGEEGKNYLKKCRKRTHLTVNEQHARIRKWKKRFRRYETGCKGMKRCKDGVRAGLKRASNRAFGHRLLSEDRGSHLTPGF